ncbi:hypothetical protein EKN06_10280 [Croceicoccus ponticola]|uniref:Uncharacterized protein n=1 Tax=Croceicoccus ponticola TaxID=2217664 RepID=A0A437GWC3_9SPHN|nr:hypothetical protein [Croceicoccus ponticola]RVQ66404.1 hypothetical protein EKN06_10280 [Croceicoccus ponticola]
MATKVVKIVQICALAGIAALSGCTPPPPPAPPPPPPPVVEAFPARPLAPGYAQENLAVPPIDAFGVRQTVNTGLTSAQTTWNLRSAYNVAALNCQGADHLVMAERYGEFLKGHARELSATNRALDSEFRQKYGPGYKDVRDRYMTQVYNYFAMPPVLPRFCAAAFNVSTELMAVGNGNLDVAAATLLPQLETVFLQFFTEYEAFRIAATAWDASYFATYGVPYRRPSSNPLQPSADVPYGPGAPVTMPVTIPAPMPVAGAGVTETGS